MVRNDPIPDEALVEACRVAREGDTRPFDELVRRYEPAVRTNCRFLSRSESDSPDLAQEVLVKAYFGLARYQERSSFRTWLWRIKANHCLNYLEKQRVRERVVSMPNDSPTMTGAQDPTASPEADLAASEKRAAIGRVLDGMEDTLRVPLILRDLDGLSYAEIADELDIGLSAAKMRVSRAREEFRRKYGQEGGSEE